MKLAELNIPGSRSSFIETWLTEMPSGLGAFETFETLEYSIRDFLRHGIKPQQVGELNKLDLGDKFIYWFGTETNVQLASELHVKPEGLIVSMTGKNPALKGKAPFASQLYSAVLKDLPKNIRVLSDDQLSDEGFSLWKKMVALGHKVSVYDAGNPGKSFQSFETPEELEQFFKHDDTDFRRYRYILSEDVMQYCSMRASFRLRLLRESTPGMALEDYEINPIR